jgi:membrane protease YdiL (CAAX protease family)
MNNKRLQIFELALVVSIGFLPAIIISLNSILTGDAVYENYQFTAIRYFYSIVQALLSIVLMFYVLYRQGKNFESIGLKLAPLGRDFSHAFVIIILAVFIRALFLLPVNFLFPGFSQQASHPKNIEFLHSNLIFFMTILVIVIPLQEELIVRGFTMKSVFDISNKKYLAVIISVIIQFSYHLYQGLPAALSLLPIFTVYALYFVRFGNLNPVILAHIMTDVWALVYRR